jgi:NADPH-dependent curcumin reductase CurA
LAALPQPFDMRRFFGVSVDVERVLRQKNIKTELWMVDSFYHERLRAEDDLSRLLTAGKVRPVHHVVRGFEKLPEAITGLYNTPRAGKLQVSF